ncbi:MAG: DUF6069 family protein [Chloroflexota bacterium]
MSVSTDINIAGTRPSLGKLPQAVLVGAILSMIGNMIILFFGRGLGVEFMLVPPTGTELEPLPFFPIVMIASILPAVGAALLLYILGWFTERPYPAFWTIAVLFLLISFQGPVGAVTDSAQTVIGLNAMHVWSALAIVGALSALGHEDA